MFPDHPKVSRLLSLSGLLGLSFFAWPPLATAQDHTADPYKPYNSAYESYVYPSYPTNGLMPNQSVLEGRAGGYGRANRFQDYMEGGEDDFGFGRSRSGAGVPYYSAYRQFDRYGRDYDRGTQGASGDRAYHEDQQARQEKYLEYLRERDPKKRAELYREYTSESRKAARDLSNTRGSLSRANSTAADKSANPRTRRDAVNAGTDGASSRPPGLRMPGTSGTSRAPGLGSSGASSSSSRSSLLRSPSRTLSPSEVLKRSDDMDAANGIKRTPSAPGLRPRS